MEKDEIYLSESPLNGKPCKKINIVIKDKAITTSKLADGSVTSDKLSDNAVTGEKIQKETIEFSHLSVMLACAIKAATGLPEDLIEEMSYLYKKINELQAISEDDINKIVDGSYVIDAEETVPITEYIKKQINILTKALEKNEKDDAYTRLRLESFIDSRLTPDQVNEALSEE